MDGTMMVLAWVWSWQAYAAIGCGIAVAIAAVILPIADRAHRQAERRRDSAEVFDDERARAEVAVGTASAVCVFSLATLIVAFFAGGVLSLFAFNESTHADYRESQAECHHLLDVARSALHATPSETSLRVRTALTRGDAASALRDAISEAGCPADHLVEEHADAWAKQTAQRENTARVAEALTGAGAISPLALPSPAPANAPPVDPSAARAVAALVAANHPAN